MSKRSIALGVAVAVSVFAFPAHADLVITTHLPVLPSIRPHTPAGATAALPASGTLAGFLEGVRSSAAMRPKDDGPRDPTLRDPARTRDATSLGLQSPATSGIGMGLAGLALGAGATLRLPRATKKFPLTIGPFVMSGGGGIRLGVKW